MGQHNDQDLKLRIESVEKYRTRQRFKDDALPLQRSNGVSIAFEKPSMELSSSHSDFRDWRSSHSLNRAILPYLLLWLRSGKNLDLCLLALCSCILSLLCHQPISSLPTSPTTTSSAAPVSSPAAGLSGVDLVIKAGLFTTSRPEDETERSQE